MRSLISSILILSFNFSLAAPMGIKNETSAAKTYAQDLIFPNNQSTKQLGLDTRIETGNQNLLVNPSFESATVTTGWTSSEVGSIVKSSAEPLDGKFSLEYDASSGLNISQVSTINAARLNGLQMMASIYVKSEDPDVNVCAVVNSADTNCVKAITNNTWKHVQVPFIAGGTNNGIRVKSTGAGLITVIDNAFVGLSSPFQNVNGAKLVGTGTMSPIASCSYATTSTTFVSFGAVAACNSLSVTGSIKAPTTKIPAFVLPAGSPAGTYMAVVSGIFQKTGTTAEDNKWRLNDGTNTWIGQGYNYAGTTNSSANGGFTSSFTYSTSLASDTTVNIQGASSNAATASATINVTDSNGPLHIQVYYFPPESKIYSQASQEIPWTSYTPTLSSGFGTVTPASNQCKYRTNRDMLDVQCFFAAGTTTATIGSISLPSGFTIDSSKLLANGTTSTVSEIVGTYQGGIGANNDAWILAATGSSLTNVYTSGAVTGTSIALIPSGVNSTTASTATVSLSFSVPVVEKKDYGVIVGSFAGIEKCANDYECTDTFSAKVTSAGVVSDENLDWINGNFTVSPTGVFTATLNTNLKDGTNALSNPMNCVVSQGEGIGGTGLNASIPASTNTASTLIVNTGNAGTAGNYRFTVKCQKAGQDYKPKTAKVASSIGVPTVPGAGAKLYDFFGVSYAGATTSTTCSTSPCTLYNKIGDGVLSITRSGVATYNINFNKTYSSISCTAAANNGASYLSVVSSGTFLSCSNCNTLQFQSGTGSSGSDSYGTFNCIGSY